MSEVLRLRSVLMNKEISSQGRRPDKTAGFDEMSGLGQIENETLTQDASHD